MVLSQEKKKSLLCVMRNVAFTAFAGQCNMLSVFHCVARKRSHGAAIAYAMHTRFLDYTSQFNLSKYYKECIPIYT